MRLSFRFWSSAIMSASSDRSLLARQLRRSKVKGSSKCAIDDGDAEDASGSSDPDREQDARATRRYRTEDGQWQARTRMTAERVSDADLKAMGIESFVSKQGNLCFRVSATPSPGLSCQFQRVSITCRVNTTPRSQKRCGAC